MFSFSLYGVVESLRSETGEPLVGHDISRDEKNIVIPVTSNL
jgi:hypothetical protein